MKIAVDCDDAAVAFKDEIYNYLKQNGYDITDLKYSASHDCDYPEIAFNLAEAIKNKEYDRGFIFCGTGLGVAMMANKVPGVFAGTCHDVYSAERLAKSNNANVLTMGARVIGTELAKMVAEAWLKSDFQGGGSRKKVDAMRRLEKTYLK
ncbi:MAG: RpiB/LacA/LacB family sugar-phosphate isomerase [Firmicutes bacterium]|nr:RpiB/LacA/LacB family sugar-phosphate isomerase [Bacillota bacterium]